MADASDADFDRFVRKHGIPVDSNGIAEWSFDDRCRAINYGIRNGVIWHFVEGKTIPNNSPNNSDSELFGKDEAASEAV